MPWKPIVALLVAALTMAPTLPPATAMQRHAEMRTLGTQICFERLARGSPQVGTTIIQAGTNATDLCACVGELFATSFITGSVDLAKIATLDVSAGNPATELFNSYNQLCIGRLQTRVGN